MLCRVPNFGHSAKSLFAVCHTRQRMTLGKEPLCRVVDRHPTNFGTQQRASLPSVRNLAKVATRQRCFFLPLNFFYCLYSWCWSVCSNLTLFSIYLLYIFNLFHLNVFFQKYNIELQVHRIIEFDDWKNNIHDTWSFQGAHPKFQTSYTRNMAIKMWEKYILII